MATLIWTEPAVADLEEIGQFISKDNPPAAEKVGSKIIREAENVAAFPRLGGIVPEFGNPQIREIISQSYRVIYKFDEEGDLVAILRLDFFRDLFQWCIVRELVNSVENELFISHKFGETSVMNNSQYYSVVTPPKQVLKRVITDNQHNRQPAPAPSFVCRAWSTSAHTRLGDGFDCTAPCGFLASAYEPCRFRTSIRAELSIAAPLMAVFGVCPQSQRSI
jgi:toxin ParE1/3/4